MKRKVSIEILINFDESTMNWCNQDEIDGVVGEALDGIINKGLENEEVNVDFLSIDVEEI